MTSVGEFFDENFKTGGCQIVLKENFESAKPNYPLYKHNKIIGYIEFDKTNKELENFLDTALYLISLKVQNIVLSRFS